MSACLVLASVLPIVLSRSVPAFQQDWSWPISRDFAHDWISSFIGQWSSKGLGQPNVLPLQTYLSLAQYGLILVLGPSLALAVYLAAVELAALFGLVAMLRELGLQARGRQFIIGCLYALGPVMFTRVQAGHLAFVLAYALLPSLFVLSRRVLAGNRLAVLWLAIAYALAASQPQFLVYGAVVIASALLYTKPRQHVSRLVAAIVVGVVLQLQGIVPLLTSAAPSVYTDERPIVAWEQNLSAPLAAAAIGMGYFPQYYERKALRGAALAAWGVLVLSALLTLVRSRRTLALGFGLWLLGFLVASGLNGPLAGVLETLVTNFAPASAFRDFSYASALTMLGTAVLAGCALDFVLATGFAYVVAAAFLIEPAVAGMGLQPLLLPSQYADDTAKVTHMIAAHGDGRVLWLPSEEPVGLLGGSRGLDIAIYGLPHNASANQQRDLRVLAFAVSSLRAGLPQLDSFRRLGIRYFVVRDYILSARDSSLGTGMALAFQGIPDSALGSTLEHTNGVRLIGRASHSVIFSLDGALPIVRKSTADPAAMLQSTLALNRTAVLERGARVVELATSRETADPRKAWVGDFVGRWYTPWISDSLYPYVWTVSNKALRVDEASAPICGVVSSNANVVGAEMLQPLSSSYRKYVSSRQFVIFPRGVTAVSGVSGCSRQSLPGKSLLVFESRYDAGWRLVHGHAQELPVLADGWAMAWTDPSPPYTLVYLPAFEQTGGIILALIALALTWSWTRRVS